ncbi:MAG: DUF4421 family protein [Flavobacteriales bacterium]|nr:DUF4421 family protein [Flavobacteriales bacterium]
MSNTHRYAVILFCTLIGLLANATKTNAQKEGKDRQYVEPINPLIAIRPYIKQNVDFYTIGDRDGEMKPLMYRTASGVSFGGQFTFKFFNFSYERTMPLLQPKLTESFQPVYQQFGLGFEGRSFGMSFNLAEYKGFVLQNRSQIPDSLYSDVESVVYRQDMRAKSFNAALRFTFSRSVSAKALFEQSERQKRSAGAFGMMLAEKFVELRSDSSFVPAHIQDQFSETATMNRLWINNIQLMVGYGYIAAAADGKLNAGLFMYTGSGPQIRQWSGDDGRKRSLRFPAVAKVRAGLALNGKYIYGRIIGDFDYTTMGMKDSRMRWWETYWEVSVGFRLYSNKK